MGENTEHADAAQIDPSGAVSTASLYSMASAHSGYRACLEGAAITEGDA
jgi:hypothetical protein